MLLIFVFSITPKILLHNLTAGHKDISCHSEWNIDKVTTAGFHCNCENQVVELPYLNQVNGVRLMVSGAFHSYQTSVNSQAYFFPPIIFGLRGPPSAI